MTMRISNSPPTTRRSAMKASLSEANLMTVRPDMSALHSLLSPQM
jgi:hypothetical protein